MTPPLPPPPRQKPLPRRAPSASAAPSPREGRMRCLSPPSRLAWRRLALQQPDTGGERLPAPLPPLPPPCPRRPRSGAALPCPPSAAPPPAIPHWGAAPPRAPPSPGTGPAAPVGRPPRGHAPTAGPGMRRRRGRSCQQGSVRLQPGTGSDLKGGRGKRRRGSVGWQYNTAGCSQGQAAA